MISAFGVDHGSISKMVVPAKPGARKFVTKPDDIKDPAMVAVQQGKARTLQYLKGKGFFPKAAGRLSG